MKSDEELRLTIDQAIEAAGYHLTMVGAGRVPRFAYTTGLSVAQSARPELVLAGAAIYQAADARAIVDAAAQTDEAAFRIDGVGSFRLSPVDESWVKELLLAANRYSGQVVQATQIVPDSSCIDVPDMSVRWDPNESPIWQWMDPDRHVPLPPAATAVTNVGLLRGESAIEAARWEHDQWEVFSVPGSTLERDDARFVPLLTLLAHDPSLLPVVDLRIGDGVERTTDASPWTPWSEA